MIKVTKEKKQVLAGNLILNLVVGKSCSAVINSSSLILIFMCLVLSMCPRRSMLCKIGLNKPKHSVWMIIHVVSLPASANWGDSIPLIAYAIFHLVILQGINIYY